MRFLDDFKYKRTTETNITSQIEEKNRADSLSPITDLNFSRSESEDREVALETYIPCENRKRKAKNIEEPSDKILEYLKKKNEQKQHKTVDHFFLSYA